MGMHPHAPERFPASGREQGVARVARARRIRDAARAASLGARVLRGIAFCTLLEAWRGPLPVLVAVSLGAAFAVAAIGEAMAITEAVSTRILLLGAMLRAFTVLTLAFFVVTSVVREENDRVVEMVFSQARPRSDYYFGKLAACAALAVVLAGLCGLCLLVHAPMRTVALWAASLALELWMVAAAGLFCVLTLRHALTALLAVLAFYVLGRSIGALRRLSESPLTASADWTEHPVDAFVAFLYYVLPDLGRYASADWLVYPPDGFADASSLAVQAALWVALISGATLFDLYRRNL